jgi:LysR family transcriptional regulator, transcriptional activator of nhaA
MAALNFRHLLYFHAIAAADGLTRAAKRLNVSPSALSIQLQQLEHQLGHALFERRGRRLVLTEAGRMVRERAGAIFAAGDELVASLKGAQPSARGAVRVGALATLSRNFQMQFLRPLLGRTDVEIVLRSGTLRELLQGLEAHRIDVLLANLAPPRDAATPWISRLIADQPVSLVGHPRHARKRRRLDDLLAHEPLVVPSAESSVRGDLDAFLARRDIRATFAAEVDDMAMLRLLAREDIGLAVVPPIVVRDELEAGTLVELRRLPDLKERFYAITLARKFPNPLLAALLK